MMASGGRVDQSIDRQINEARQRAQVYAESLRDAKERESRTIQTLEAEKNKWMESFEKKSVMVNQLEKELTSAVEVIEAQKRANMSPPRGAVPGFSVPILTEEAIHEDLKRMLSSSMGRGNVGLSSSLRADGSSSLPGTPAVWNELLNQYKDNLQRARTELSDTVRERSQLADDNAVLLTKMKQQAEDIDQLALARDDISAKMQFRMNQIRELEQEKVKQATEMKALQIKLEDMELRVYSADMHSQVLSSDNEKLKEDVKRMEERLLDPGLQQHVHHLQTTILDLQQHVQNLTSRLSSKDQSHSDELQQLKKIIQSLQLRIRPSEQLQDVHPTQTVLNYASPMSLSAPVSPMVSSPIHSSLNSFVRDQQSSHHSISSAGSNPNVNHTNVPVHSVVDGIAALELDVDNGRAASTTLSAVSAPSPEPPHVQPAAHFASMAMQRFVSTAGYSFKSASPLPTQLGVQEHDVRSSRSSQESLSFSQPQVQTIPYPQPRDPSTAAMFVETSADDERRTRKSTSRKSKPSKRRSQSLSSSTKPTHSQSAGTSPVAPRTQQKSTSATKRSSSIEHSAKRAPSPVVRKEEIKKHVVTPASAKKSAKQNSAVGHSSAPRERRLLEVMIPTSQPLSGRRDLYEEVHSSQPHERELTSSAGMPSSKHAVHHIIDHHDHSLVSLSTTHSTDRVRVATVTPSDSGKKGLSFSAYKMKTGSPAEAAAVGRKFAPVEAKVPRSLLKPTFSSAVSSRRVVGSS